MSRTARTPPPADLTDLQLAQLARLAEIGMEIAEAAGRQARGGGEGEGAGADPALSFARAARAVRLTIALQQRLVADRAASGREEAAARAAEAVRRRDRIHAKVERCVERVAEAEGGDAEAAEHRSSAAWERLTETEDEELLGRPVEEVVARICADLGLSAAFAIDAFRDCLPSPSMGEGSGMGVLAPTVRQKARVAPPPALIRQRPRPTPNPTLPPSRGKGSAPLE